MSTDNAADAGTEAAEQHDGVAVPMSRLERRKARTREALLDAARSMLAAGTAANASIQDITNAADVGFGSFYNHFDGKTELFAAALEQVLEQWGQILDRVVVGIADPAEVFTVCVRTTGRLGLTHPQFAAVIADAGFSVFDSPIGLAPRATRDIARCIEAGRFTIENVPVAFTTAAGSLLGLLHLWLKGDGHVDEASVDDVAEQILRMYGLSAREAKKLAHKPLRSPC